MKIPKIPPDINELLRQMTADDFRRFSEFVANYNIVDEKGRYLHWEELRFKSNPDALKPEEVWLATKLARNSVAQKLPLSDSSGKTFSFCEPSHLRATLRELDMNAGGLLGANPGISSETDGRTYLRRSLAEEPFSSSLIEGAATTRKIAKNLIFDGRLPRTRDERMVLNNFEAMEFVKAHCNDPLSLELLLEIHRIVTKDTLDDGDAGRIRTTDDIRVIDERTGEILHQPPDAAALRDRLRALIDFANSEPDPRDWVHPLIKATLLHFMLGYEHPFVDGNGRVARALFYWSALRDGYWLMEYVSISSVIAESRIKYGESYLDTETDGGDTTYFLIHNIEVLKKAVVRLGDYVERRRGELAAFEKGLSGTHDFNHRQSWLLQEILADRLSQTTIAEHQDRFGTSYLTARSDLEGLVSHSLLGKSKQGRTSFYKPVREFSARLKPE